jgi:hypothetical protein
MEPKHSSNCYIVLTYVFNCFFFLCMKDTEEKQLRTGILSVFFHAFIINNNNVCVHIHTHRIFLSTWDRQACEIDHGIWAKAMTQFSIILEDCSNSELDLLSWAKLRGTHHFYSVRKSEELMQNPRVVKSLELYKAQKRAHYFSKVKWA